LLVGIVGAVLESHRAVRNPLAVEDRLDVAPAVGAAGRVTGPHIGVVLIKSEHRSAHLLPIALIGV
jgi:hypothetical protein